MSIISFAKRSAAVGLTALALVAATPLSAAELPDFVALVEKYAPAVVNISTVRTTRESGERPRSRNEELDDFFRRFFPPRDGGRGGGRAFPRPQSLGSGFVLDSDGYILTNNHVVEGAQEILVRFSDRRELTAELIGADPPSDLALLKVDATSLPTLKMAESDDLKVGEWVLAIGSPFGFDYSVTAGIVSAKGRSLPTEQRDNYVPFIQTDVAINPGNSGGPLFNLKGEVVGINSQIYSNSGGFMGVSFAIPIALAMEVVAQLKASGRVARGWLGVVIQEVDSDLAESFGLDRPHGALIARVMAGSPAEAGGIKEADIITAFNDQPIDLSSELQHYVGRTLAGSNAKLDVIRDGKEIVIHMDIGEKDRDEPTAAVADSPREEPSRLGLSLENVPASDVEALGIDGGVRVVDAEGLAAQSGIRPGDIITKLNNREVRSLEDFSNIADELSAGRSVAVLVIRGQSPIFLALRVPE
jgi:serine protease Do